jgi:hypothetical protein
VDLFVESNLTARFIHVTKFVMKMAVVLVKGVVLVENQKHLVLVVLEMIKKLENHVGIHVTKF